MSCPDSSFPSCGFSPQQYAEDHKEELEKLRLRAEELGWGEMFCIIGDETYEAKREQYATTSFAEHLVSPRLIFAPRGEQQVVDAIKLCVEFDMKLAVRTGGHQYCGYSSTSPNNMQLDLSESFPEYDYNPQTNVLRCGVSHALGDWAKKNAALGIYLPMGVCSAVHLGGHVHTGGWGPVARSHGLLADHVLAFDIILASGEKKHITRPKEAGNTLEHDIFYAVLGGGKGGDFGIVTHWEFSPLRDKDYPHSVCYDFVWLWSKKRMEAAVDTMQKISKMCASGEIPSDYEFMVTISGLGVADVMPLKVKTALNLIGLDEDGGVPIPALIFFWGIYTNKSGKDEFDEKWFEMFAENVGKPTSAHREKNFPVSEGICDFYVLPSAREMEYPYVKRFRVSNAVPDNFAEVFTDRMYEIMGWFGTSGHQHLVSQMQVYAGGAVSHIDEQNLTAYSWRGQAFAMSHDSFYSKGLFGGSKYNKAEAWQAENDKAFVEKGAFADKDMRMFAYTFGKRNLAEVWHLYYDSEEKYERLKKIKKALDADGVFCSDEFCLSPGK
uniref:FAD-binding PCMH-type domain-containing protein n=1 Tax=Paramoeba aestuarina TaxID=180227 RepID=A0A7S4KE57_9EUKA|mmetsp:Transcript_17654/g.27636  ORF Transcript_17654/g.27636 Transcript_17654/m.27636 type:complete len:553 (+) Transcript_17654:118-1776(+)|eukprot:CAMPEP_0201521666 /NCGR_PEP_ID=MMETSP0161_2-20130828/15514_1 /ASSEMBLY_ACC=CAM_ASM_000251 /TAXON_ID=180227 /ORGANISM="Neoparamoeba aestuarina, Strain SoJaBio B1-5/56/2" /LENGTH=552 /DNA_ID=CAMNT_0047920341 /DNA_START=104 /DNA_END=1762 /DNA_ORIENTATION=+